jgi:hypothetical protein
LPVFLTLLYDHAQGTQMAMSQLFTEPSLCMYVNTRTSYEQSAPMGSASGVGGRFQPPPMNQNQGYQPHPPMQQQPQNYGQGNYVPPMQQPQNYGQNSNQQQNFAPQGQAQQNSQAPNRGQSQDHRQQQQQYQQSNQYQPIQPPPTRQPEYNQNNQGNNQNNQSNNQNNQGNQKAIHEVTPPAYTSDGSSITMTMGVPDCLVGTILGRQGVVVKEMMSLSGTQIQV